jgi:spore photoproduct lyase
MQRKFLNSFDISQKIQEYFQTLRFSKNNLEEITIFISEICIREDKNIEEILAEEELNKIYQEKNLPWKRKVEKSKEYLFTRRYSLLESSIRNPKGEGVSAELEISQIYIEEEVKNSKIAQNVINNLPNIPLQYIKHIKELKPNFKKQLLPKENQATDESIFNKNELVIAKQRGKFLKPCPCSQGCLNCGYYVIENAINCPYDCKYCYLQSYLNNPYLIVYANTKDLFQELSDSPFLNKKNSALAPFRIGTGEFADSLALDEITESSLELIPYFLEKNNAILELKTKSDKIKNIIKFDPKGKIVVSWSINPQNIMDLLEDGCTTLEQRIKAAKKCEEVGYKIGFHFDPIIHYQDWENDYKRTVDFIFANIKPKNVAWISLGTLRFSPKLKKIIRLRFPDCKIFYDQLDIDFDGKIRYLKPIREEMFKKMNAFIKSYSSDIDTYLCMEKLSTCRTAFQ